jgi:hypothetical protein
MHKRQAGTVLATSVALGLAATACSFVTFLRHHLGS